MPHMISGKATYELSGTFFIWIVAELNMLGDINKYGEVI